MRQATYRLIATGMLHERQAMYMFILNGMLDCRIICTGMLQIWPAMFRLTAIDSASQCHAIQNAGADTFRSETHHENVAGCSLNKINNSLIVFPLGQALL
jgi:hypothetical protein